MRMMMINIGLFHVRGSVFHNLFNDLHTEFSFPTHRTHFCLHTKLNGLIAATLLLHNCQSGYDDVAVKFMWEDQSSAVWTKFRISNMYLFTYFWNKWRRMSYLTWNHDQYVNRLKHIRGTSHYGRRSSGQGILAIWLVESESLSPQPSH
jgi:hypothetical protein